MTDTSKYALVGSMPVKEETFPAAICLVSLVNMIISTSDEDLVEEAIQAVKPFAHRAVDE